MNDTDNDHFSNLGLGDPRLMYIMCTEYTGYKSILLGGLSFRRVEMYINYFPAQSPH